MGNSKFNILIIGGYGNFGARIARSLACDPRYRVIISGRKLEKADRLCSELKSAGVTAAVEALRLDQSESNLAGSIAATAANLVIHTSGPYQGQDYRVARACIDAGANYLDLADGRDFVAGIRSLDRLAREKGLMVVSGVSTLPGLSSAVVDALKGRFSRLVSMDMSIAPGQRAGRGLATLAGVMTYCGKPFRVWEGGAWKTAYGWQDARRFSYPVLGKRVLARCDVPDLELFPDHYAPIEAVRFDAALELAVAQAGLWCLSWLSRAGMVKSPERLAPAFFQAARCMDVLGSDLGGMHLRLKGLDPSGRVLAVTWFLTARNGCGPDIPSIPAVILAGKMATGALSMPGAYPCLGIFTLDEFNAAVGALPIETQVVERSG